MEETLKISLPIDEWDPARGGAERYLVRFTEAICARRHEVTVLCLAARDGAALRPKGLQVDILRVPRFPRWLRELSFASASARAHRRSGRDLLFAVRHALEADVYQPHGGCFRAARRASRRSLPPSRRWMHDLGAASRPSLRVLLWLDRQVFLRSPRVVTVSVSAKVEEDFRRAYPDVAFRFERLHNAIDVERFHDRDRAERSRELRARFSIPERDRIALFVGHGFRLKGLLHALEVIRRADAWHLVVAGRDEAAPFMRQARRLGVEGRVHFAGAVADPRPLYAACEALLQPTYYDPCSLSTLESLACGTPVVTTAHNGAGELLVKGGAGLVVEEPCREAEMAAGLREMEKRWGDFRLAASSLAPALSWPDHLSRLEEILSRALKTRSVKSG